MLALAVMAIVAASAAVSVARTPSEEESASTAPATATPAMVVPERLAHRVGGAFAQIPDEAAMVLVGAALFGVAAAVKRAA